MPKSLPFDLELAHFARGQRVFGVDEVGRGCLAGPVVAGCVGFGEGAMSYELWAMREVIVNDSKKLTREQRREAAKVIRDVATYVEVGIVSAAAIDEINILQATFEAMREACGKQTPSDSPFVRGRVRIPLLTKEAWPIGQRPRGLGEVFLIDGNQKIPNFAGEQETVIGGDGKVFSIAAASIVAKEFRDALMEELDLIHAGYGFAKHKGYGTKEHYAAIEKLGLCREHRRTFLTRINSLGNDTLRNRL